MSELEQSAFQQRAQYELDYWNQFHRAQPHGDQNRVEMFPLSGKGTVYSHTTVTTPAEDFEPYAPYAMALVQLDEGPMITAQLTDLDGDVTIGMRVEMVVRKLRTDGERGIIVYGPKFRPLLEPDNA